MKALKHFFLCFAFKKDINAQANIIEIFFYHGKIYIFFYSLSISTLTARKRVHWSNAQIKYSEYYDKKICLFNVRPQFLLLITNRKKGRNQTQTSRMMRNESDHGCDRFPTVHFSIKFRLILIPYSRIIFIINKVRFSSRIIWGLRKFTLVHSCQTLDILDSFKTLLKCSLYL